MFLTVLTGLVLNAAIAAPSTDQIQSVLHNDAGWQADGVKDGVQVYTKPMPGSELSAWKGVRVSSVDADILWALISDVGNHDQISDMLHETKVLASSPTRTDYFQVSKSPRFVPVSERYWLNYAQVVLSVDGTPGHNRRVWNSIEDTTPYTAVIDGILTRYPEAIRLAATHGSWTLRPLADGQVEITYRTFSDPGGSVPSSVMDYLSGRSLPDNILQFEEAALARQ